MTSLAMRIWLLMYLIVFGVPVIGQADAGKIEFTEWATTSCISKAPEGYAQLDCIGKSAQACIQATRDGETTVGMMACYDTDRAYWDKRLNTAYQVLINQRRTSDLEMQKLGSSAQPVVEALRIMQSSWISWRDASCAYAAARWIGGTGGGGGPASAACVMMMTARQALSLEDWRDKQ